MLLLAGMLLGDQSLAQDKSIDNSGANPTGANVMIHSKEKPRVYPAGRGTLNAVSSSGGAAGWSAWNAWAASASSTTVDAHSETMELAKDFGKKCPGLLVTFDARKADYAAALNRESKLKRWPMTSSQILVMNRVGDMIKSDSTHSVSDAANEACKAILADWVQHGRLEASTSSAPATLLPAPFNEPSQGSASTKQTPDDSQQRYIRVVNANGTVSYIPECKQTSTGSCEK